MISLIQIGSNYIKKKDQIMISLIQTGLNYIKKKDQIMTLLIQTGSNYTKKGSNHDIIYTNKKDQTSIIKIQCKNIKLNHVFYYFNNYINKQMFCFHYYDGRYSLHYACIWIRFT